jgi:hypothetical protein
MRKLPDASAIAQRLRGHRLPGGEFVIAESDVPTVANLVGSPTGAATQAFASGSGAAHPVFASIASLRTLGMSIAEMCALCDFDLADGPLLGECDIEFDAPMRAGVRYVATGAIESYERVASRRLGTLDRLRFVVELADAEGAPVARVSYLWLLPRGRSAA